MILHRNCLCRGTHLFYVCSVKKKNEQCFNSIFKYIFTLKIALNYEMFIQVSKVKLSAIVTEQILENDRSTSADIIGANSKYTRSTVVKSSGSLGSSPIFISLRENTFKIFKRGRHFYARHCNRIYRKYLFQTISPKKGYGIEIDTKQRHKISQLASKFLETNLQLTQVLQDLSQKV